MKAHSRGLPRLLKNVRRKIWPLHRLISKELVISGPQGTFAVSTRDDTIGKRFFTHGSFEDEWMKQSLSELQRRSLISPEGTMLDLGANMGVSCITALNWKYCNKAIAVEPSPANQTLLARNVTLNGLEDRVLMVNCAVGATRGTMSLELDKANFGDNRLRNESSMPGLLSEEKRPVVQVEVRTVDDILEQLHVEPGAISFVWIDVQGFEGHAFLGSPRLFQLGVPVVAELWPYGLERAGHSVNDFIAIAAKFWNHVLIPNNGSLEKFPISHISVVAKRLKDIEHENIILIR